VTKRKSSATHTKEYIFCDKNAHQSHQILRGKNPEKIITFRQ